MERLDYNPSDARNGTLRKGAISKMDYYGRWRGMNIYCAEKGKHVEVYFAYDNRQVVFALDLEEMDDVGAADGRPIYTVNMSSIDRPFQGFGFAHQAYREVMRRLEIIICAGWCQSKGARKMWAKLNTLSNVVILVGNEYVPLHEVESDFESNEMTSPEMEVYDNDARAYAFVI